MIFAFENLKEYDKKIVKAGEPYIDFIYSNKEACYKWQQHHLIIDGKDIYKLRLHSAENLRQGFICTNFAEAKKLSMLIEGDEAGLQLKKDYMWLDNYILEQKENHFLNVVALPVSEYIKHYANDFKMLKLLDFEKILTFRNK
jgi:hypothetical protein